MIHLQKKSIFVFMAWLILFLLFTHIESFGSQLEGEKQGEFKNDISQLSEEEMDWYQRFQNGIPFFDGWKKISHDIVTQFPHNDRTIVKESLKSLGKKIGIEWCKDNSIRKIDTGMLRAWGESLNEAVDRGKKHLSDAINRVEKEVDGILTDKFASNQE